MQMFLCMPAHVKGKCAAQLLASGVRVSVAYPPDTDTPGYTAEQQTKARLLDYVHVMLQSSPDFPERPAYSVCMLSMQMQTAVPC